MLKSFILTLLSCFIITTIFSQTQKGNILISNNLAAMSYSSTSISYTNSTPNFKEPKRNKININVTPSLAYFIANNIAIGTSLTYGYVNNMRKPIIDPNTGEELKQKNASHAIYLGPMARYYFVGSNSGKLFVQASFQFGFKTEKNDYLSPPDLGSNIKTKYKGAWNSGINIGYEHFINQYIGIIASVGVSYGKFKLSEEITSNLQNPGWPTQPPYTMVTHNKSNVSTLTIPLNIGLQIHLPR